MLSLLRPTCKYLISNRHHNHYKHGIYDVITTIMLTLSFYILKRQKILNTLFICYSYYTCDRARYTLQGDHGNGILMPTLEATKDAVNFQRQRKPFLPSKTN